MVPSSAIGNVAPGRDVSNSFVSALLGHIDSVDPTPKMCAMLSVAPSASDPTSSSVAADVQGLKKDVRVVDAPDQARNAVAKTLFGVGSPELPTVRSLEGPQLAGELATTSASPNIGVPTGCVRNIHPGFCSSETAQTAAVPAEPPATEAANSATPATEEVINSSVDKPESSFRTTGGLEEQPLSIRKVVTDGHTAKSLAKHTPADDSGTSEDHEASRLAQSLLQPIIPLQTAMQGSSTPAAVMLNPERAVNATASVCSTPALTVDEKAPDVRAAIVKCNEANAPEADGSEEAGTPVPQATTGVSAIEENHSVSRKQPSSDEAAMPNATYQDIAERPQTSSPAVATAVPPIAGAVFSPSLHGTQIFRRDVAHPSDITAVVAHSQQVAPSQVVEAGSSRKRLEIAIDDPDLGRMNVQAELRNGQLHATLTASDNVVSSAPALHHFLREQAITVHDLKFAVATQQDLRGTVSTTSLGNASFSFAGNADSTNQRQSSSRQATASRVPLRSNTAVGATAYPALAVDMLKGAAYSTGVSIHI